VDPHLGGCKFERQFTNGNFAVAEDAKALLDPLLGGNDLGDHSTTNYSAPGFHVDRPSEPQLESLEPWYPSAISEPSCPTLPSVSFDPESEMQPYIGSGGFAHQAAPVPVPYEDSSSFEDEFESDVDDEQGLQQHHWPVETQDDLEKGLPRAALFHTLGRQATFLGFHSFVARKEHLEPALRAGSNLAGIHSQSRPMSTIRVDILTIARRLDSKIRGREAATGCNCMNCLHLGTDTFINGEQGEFQCRLPNCGSIFTINYPRTQRAKHEKFHFGVNGRYDCIQPQCVFKNKTWAVLTRHYTGKHCSVPGQHSCPETGCKYKGEKAFKRADHLRNHINEVHRGEARIRKIKPNKKQGHSKTGTSVAGHSSLTM